MGHIEFALSVLRSEIFNLKRELEAGRLLPKEEEEIMQDIQKLNHAIMDIQKHFSA